jgi:hypothetical protein
MGFMAIPLMILRSCVRLMVALRGCALRLSFRLKFRLRLRLTLMGLLNGLIQWLRS